MKTIKTILCVAGNMLGGAILFAVLFALPHLAEASILSGPDVTVRVAPQTPPSGAGALSWDVTYALMLSELSGRCKADRQLCVRWEREEISLHLLDAWYEGHQREVCAFHAQTGGDFLSDFFRVRCYD